MQPGPTVAPVPSSPVRDYGDELAVVTVLGPADRSAATPPPLLAALPAASGTRPYEVVVVDAGADREPVAGARTVVLGEDVGYAAGIERGVAELDGSVGWVLAARPGAVPGPGVLDALREAGAAWPRAGALGPLAAPAAGSVIALLRHPDREWPAGPVPAGPGPVDRLDGSCLLLRRAALDSVGGLDARYGPLADLDLADRLTRAGWLCVLVPGVLGAPPTSDPDGRRRDGARYLSDRHPGALRTPLRAALRLRCR